MNKLAIVVLLSAGAIASNQAHASDGAVVGAVEGAIVGSHFAGAHGAVAGAIIGAIIGNSADDRYDRRGDYYVRDDSRSRVRQERDVVRYESSYPPKYVSAAPQPVYQQPTYQTYYEPRYEPARIQPRYAEERVVYVQHGYPVTYGGYRAPVVYAERYAHRHRDHYRTRHEYCESSRRY